MKRAFMVFGLVVAATFVASASASAREHRVPKGESAPVYQAPSGGNSSARRYFGNGVYNYGGHYLGNDPDKGIRGQLLRDPPDTYGLPSVRY
jgi:hypothetical protein